MVRAQTEGPILGEFRHFAPKLLSQSPIPADAPYSSPVQATIDCFGTDRLINSNFQQLDADAAAAATIVNGDLTPAEKTRFFFATGLQNNNGGNLDLTLFVRTAAGVTIPITDTKTIADGHWMALPRPIYLGPGMRLAGGSQVAVGANGMRLRQYFVEFRRGEYLVWP